MAYVDGFIVPVPKKNLARYRKIAKACGKIWLEYGATEYIECVAEDVKSGKYTSFPQSVKLKGNEIVIFSWITYKTKADRNRINKLIMKDERIAKMMNSGESMPFDGKRMIYGGFKPIVTM